jgi:UDP-N-acetylmuramate dehydrogenase
MIFEGFNLRKYNTFGLPGKASMFASIASENEILDIIKSGLTREKPTFILGGGSNILLTKDFNGLMLHPEITGISADNQSDGRVTVKAGAGVVWDDFVAWAVANGLGGTENLSLIPGQTGATAVQNIGAYGTESADIIEKVHTIDLLTGEKFTFTNEECKFGYRESIFKSELKGKHIVTAVSFSLNAEPVYNLTYGNLKTEVEKLGGTSLLTIRNAVIATRQSKLPDPSVTGNAGSFFKNPVVPVSQANTLGKDFPGMPQYASGEGRVKLAAGWLIDNCGWKGYRNGDAGVHENQALVLVNHGKATGSEILRLSEQICQSVNQRFGVSLEREVEVI